MKEREYLLDANIIIRIWRAYPYLLDKIDAFSGVDYKISKDIAGELSAKEYRNYNGMPVLTDKFMKLLDHVVDIEAMNGDFKPEMSAMIKYDNVKKIYYINENKLSISDYKLIILCEKFDKFILVTEDKKIYNSAQILLSKPRVLNFEAFIGELHDTEVF